MVVSTCGVMFTSNPEATAAEIARVCKRGGRVGLTTWPPEGTLAQMFQVMRPYMPPPPSPAPPSPFEWGRPERVGAEASGQPSTSSRDGTSVLRAPDGEAVWRLFSTGYGPTKTIAGKLDPERREQFRRDSRRVPRPVPRRTWGSHAAASTCCPSASGGERKVVLKRATSDGLEAQVPTERAAPPPRPRRSHGSRSPASTLQEGVDAGPSAEMRERIIRQADPVGFLIAVVAGRVIETYDPVKRRKVRHAPTFEQRLDAAGKLVRKVLPDLNATSLEASIDFEARQTINVAELGPVEREQRLLALYQRLTKKSQSDPRPSPAGNDAGATRQGCVVPLRSE